MIHKRYANIISKFRNSIEKKLVENGLSLPLQYLENGHYPKSRESRPSYVIPQEFISPHNHESLDQEKVTKILLDGMPKWIRDFVLNEPKLLFLMMFVYDYHNLLIRSCVIIFW